MAKESMKRWQFDQLELVRCSGDGEAAFRVALEEVERLGFAYCSFGLKGVLPVATPRAVWLSNYPIGWQDLYQQRGYVRCDPTVAAAMAADDWMLWSDALFESCPAMLREARAHGLVHGFAQPRRDSQGNVSLLSCVRTAPRITREEIDAKLERLKWLSCLCHESMLKHWGRQLGTAHDIALCDRELEVLRWSCDGKTSSDVAGILGLSEATVNFHVRNACAKLGTPNKTAAAVRAALLGLLW
jgi:LuxR family quorum-sensing system transcriptional regulator SolR